MTNLTQGISGPLFRISPFCPLTQTATRRQVGDNLRMNQDEAIENIMGLWCRGELTDREAAALLVIAFNAPTSPSAKRAESTICVREYLGTSGRYAPVSGHWRVNLVADCY